MKRLPILLIILALLLCGCASGSEPAQIAATTLPVYEFTALLCQGTPITVTRLVTEQVSCLHDYSMNVRQVKAAEAAEVIVISGAGLEDFLSDLTAGSNTIDAAQGISLLCATHSHEDQDHGSHEHSHDHDPHIWLSPENAKIMAQNICDGLCARYPQHRDSFLSNLNTLHQRLDQLQSYGEAQLAELSCRELITFHDGFAYFADAFDLTILQAVEEESGSEASAQELAELIHIVNERKLPAIFTEVSGSDSAASVICAETGAACYCLDMAMSGDSYFDAMYHNIDTIKEALE